MLLNTKSMNGIWLKSYCGRYSVDRKQCVTYLLQCMWKYLWDAVDAIVELALCWKESAVAVESRGSVRVLGVHRGELKKRSGAGQRSLTLSSISDARLTAGEEKYIKTSKLLTAGLPQDAMETREPWPWVLPSIWARWGTLLFVLCGLEPPVDHTQDR